MTNLLTIYGLKFLTCILEPLGLPVTLNKLSQKKHQDLFAAAVREAILIKQNFVREKNHKRGDGGSD